MRRHTIRERLNKLKKNINPLRPLAKRKKNKGKVIIIQSN